VRKSDQDAPLMSMLELKLAFPPIATLTFITQPDRLDLVAKVTALLQAATSPKCAN
jgi:hypothetical protein